MKKLEKDIVSGLFTKSIIPYNPAEEYKHCRFSGEKAWEIPEVMFQECLGSNDTLGETVTVSCKAR